MQDLVWGPELPLTVQQCCFYYNLPLLGKGHTPVAKAKSVTRTVLPDNTGEDFKGFQAVPTKAKVLFNLFYL